MSVQNRKENTDELHSFIGSVLDIFDGQHAAVAGTVNERVICNGGTVKVSKEVQAEGCRQNENNSNGQ